MLTYDDVRAAGLPGRVPEHGAGTQITFFYWYKSTNTDAAGATASGTQFTCFYWYKSTNTDAAGAAELCRARAVSRLRKSVRGFLPASD